MKNIYIYSLYHRLLATNTRNIGRGMGQMLKKWLWLHVWLAQLIEHEPLKTRLWSSHCGSAEMNPTSIQVRSPALLSGLRIGHWCELQCRSQMWLISHVAVTVVEAGSWSSDSTPSLGTFICHRCSPKKQKIK